MRRVTLSIVLLASAALSGFACGDPGPDTGQLCVAPEDCYPDLDRADLGEVLCVDKFERGFCTHTCETDDDCCAIPGECADGVPYVCTPLSDDKTKRCWVSCEAGAIGEKDPAQHCAAVTGPGTGCRSSGGGAENRDICAPP